MLDPSEVNPLALPSVALEDRRDLPTDPCIYFAIDGQGVVQYIGRAKNLKDRWDRHHRYSVLKKLDNVRIAYLAAPCDLLPAIEELMICRFRPPVNNSRSSDVQRKAARKKGNMVVVHTKEWTVLGLPSQLLEASKRCKKPVVQICEEAEISTSFWYNILRGANKSMSKSTLERLCNALGISLDSLGLIPE